MRSKGGLIQNRLICLDNGVWAPPRNSDHPFCEIIQCPRPRNIIHGRLISQVMIYVQIYQLPTYFSLDNHFEIAVFYNINDILMICKNVFSFIYLANQNLL